MIRSTSSSSLLDANRTYASVVSGQGASSKPTGVCKLNQLWAEFSEKLRSELSRQSKIGLRRQRSDSVEHEVKENPRPQRSRSNSFDSHQTYELTNREVATQSCFVEKVKVYKIIQIGVLEILKIRFSQDSIASVEDLYASILENGFIQNYPLDVVQMPDGLYTTLDNRRLYVAQKIVSKNDKFKIPVIVHLCSEKCPFSRYQPIRSNFEGLLEREKENDRNRWYIELPGIMNKTWGHAVILRMLNSWNLNDPTSILESPYGFNALPLDRSS